EALLRLTDHDLERIRNPGAVVGPDQPVRVTGVVPDVLEALRIRVEDDVTREPHLTPGRVAVSTHTWRDSSRARGVTRIGLEREPPQVARGVGVHDPGIDVVLDVEVLAGIDVPDAAVPVDTVQPHRFRGCRIVVRFRKV